LSGADQPRSARNCGGCHDGRVTDRRAARIIALLPPNRDRRIPPPPQGLADVHGSRAQGGFRTRRSGKALPLSSCVAPILRYCRREIHCPRLEGGHSWSRAWQKLGIPSSRPAPREGHDVTPRRLSPNLRSRILLGERSSPLRRPGYGTSDHPLRRLRITAAPSRCRGEHKAGKGREPGGFEQMQYSPHAVCSPPYKTAGAKKNKAPSDILIDRQQKQH